MDNLEQKKYPIGKFQFQADLFDQNSERYIDTIERFPSKLKILLDSWTDEQLNTPYREGGWTVRQLVHYISDSHMQAYYRFKLALTEDNPTIKPYFEEKWAELQDSRNAPLKPAQQILSGLHEKWVQLLRSMTNLDLRRTFYHPEHDPNFNLMETLSFYAWHSDHHFAHIENLKNEKKWE